MAKVSKNNIHNNSKGKLPVREVDHERTHKLKGSFRLSTRRHKYNIPIDDCVPLQQFDSGMPLRDIAKFRFAGACRRYGCPVCRTNMLYQLFNRRKATFIEISPLNVAPFTLWWENQKVHCDSAHQIAKFIKATQRLVEAIATKRDKWFACVAGVIAVTEYSKNWLKTISLIHPHVHLLVMFYPATPRLSDQVIKRFDVILRAAWKIEGGKVAAHDRPGPAGAGVTNDEALHRFVEYATKQNRPKTLHDDNDRFLRRVDEKVFKAMHKAYGISPLYTAVVGVPNKRSFNRIKRAHEIIASYPRLTRLFNKELRGAIERAPGHSALHPMVTARAKHA